MDESSFIIFYIVRFQYDGNFFLLSRASKLNLIFNIFIGWKWNWHRENSVWRKGKKDIWKKKSNAI